MIANKDKLKGNILQNKVEFNGQNTTGKVVINNRSMSNQHMTLLNAFASQMKKESKELNRVVSTSSSTVSSSSNSSLELTKINSQGFDMYQMYPNVGMNVNSNVKLHPNSVPSYPETLQKREVFRQQDCEQEYDWMKQFDTINPLFHNLTNTSNQTIPSSEMNTMNDSTNSINFFHLIDDDLNHDIFNEDDTFQHTNSTCTDEVQSSFVPTYHTAKQNGSDNGNMLFEKLYHLSNKSFYNENENPFEPKPFDEYFLHFNK